MKEEKIVLEFSAVVRVPYTWIPWFTGRNLSLLIFNCIYCINCILIVIIVLCLCACVCAYVRAAHVWMFMEKRKLDPLKLQLQAVKNRPI